MKPMQPRNVASLFAPLHDELMQTLRGLPDELWNRPTVAGAWRVREVAAHLLDGDLRKLAAHRDSHLPPVDPPPASYADVVQLINGLNASGISYSARLSTRLLTDLLEVTGRWVATFVEQLDPDAPALFSVAWAGETSSQNWMDTGREYTERWHHQMQIRDAVGAPLLLSNDWYEPLLSFSMRALPRAYASVDAPAGTAVTLAVEELVWSVVRDDGGWTLFEGAAPSPTTTVRITRNDAWRLFYNALGSTAAGSALAIEGDRTLALPIASVRSVMVQPKSLSRQAVPSTAAPPDARFPHVDLRLFTA